MEEEQQVEILGFNLKNNIEFLSSISGFASADSNVIQSIAQLMQKQKWPAKRNIFEEGETAEALYIICLLYTSPSPRDATLSRMPSSA